MSDELSKRAGQYLTFFIRSEEYAVGILQVREIIEHQSITRVPTLPRFIRGVINLRGAVTPVVDLAARFGDDETRASRTSCIVVVETKLGSETVVVGLLADAVSEVIDLKGEEIAPRPSFGAPIDVDYLLAVGKVDGRLLLMLDIDRVLSPSELESAAVAAATIDGNSLHEITTRPDSSEAPVAP